MPRSPAKPSKRRVSFNTSELAPSSAEGRSSAASPRVSPTPPKPSLKANMSKGSAKVPPELYTHSDPILRRLRLQNGHGEAVNLQKEFRDCEVVCFVFGSEWARTRGQLTDFYTVCQLAISVCSRTDIGVADRIRSTLRGGTRIGSRRYMLASTQMSKLT